MSSVAVDTMPRLGKYTFNWNSAKKDVLKIVLQQRNKVCYTVMSIFKVTAGKHRKIASEKIIMYF